MDLIRLLDKTESCDYDGWYPKRGPKVRARKINKVKHENTLDGLTCFGGGSYATSSHVTLLHFLFSHDWLKIDHTVPQYLNQSYSLDKDMIPI
jgi:hypothetical protein